MCRAPTLVSLAQIASSSHDTAHCAPLLAEARAVAETIGDEVLLDFVAEFAATYALQTAMSPETLGEVERIRNRHEEAGDLHSVARLLVEEGVAFQAVNRQDEAEPRFRRALEIFEAHEDAYGQELATRNLAGVLHLAQRGAVSRDTFLQVLPLVIDMPETVAVHLFGTASTFSDSACKLEASRVMTHEGRSFVTEEHQAEFMAIELLDHLKAHRPTYQDRVVLVADDGA